MVATAPSYQPLYQYNYTVSLVNKPQALIWYGKNILFFFTWTRSDAAHDHVHCLPLTETASMLSWGVSAGPHPGSVALTAAA